MQQVDHLYNVIKDLFFILDAGDQQFFGRYNLSITRYYALYHLVHTPGISLSELSRLLLCDKSNVTRMVQSLEKDGLLDRQPHETDKRSSRLFVSAAGHKLQQEIAAAHQTFNENRFETSLAGLLKNDLTADLDQLKQTLLADWIEKQAHA